jgi:hypothetical protein
MKRAIIGGLVGVLLTAGAVAAWSHFRPRPPEAETIEQQQYRWFLAETGHGHAGKMSSGTAGKEWSAYNPWYREGPLQVYAGQAGVHGTQRGPVFLLMLRLAPGVPYALGGGMMINASSAMEISVSQYAADGKPFPFVWKAEGIPDIVTITPISPRFTETLTAGGKPYELKNGRVFLVDLTKGPPTVTQVDGDLVDLFKGARDEITTDELKAIVRRLSDLERPVEKFLGALPRP